MSDEYVRLLRSARESAPSALTEFLQSRTNEDTIVAFVEGGDDEAFYITYLQALSEDVLLIRCYTKEGVIRAHEDISAKASAKLRKATMFLCDRDFDAVFDVDVPDAIFRTSFYSIESYLIDEGFFKGILARKCGLTRKLERDEVATRLMERVQRCAESLSAIFSAMAEERRSRCSADFDKFPLAKFVEVDQERELLVVQMTLEELLLEFDVDAQRVPMAQELWEKIDGMDFRLWFRGRHLWQLVRRVRHEFFKDLPRGFEESFSVNGLREYSQTVDPPSELLHYFDSRLSQS